MPSERGWCYQVTLLWDHCLENGKGAVKTEFGARSTQSIYVYPKKDTVYYAIDQPSVSVISKATYATQIDRGIIKLIETITKVLGV